MTLHEVYGFSADDDFQPERRRPSMAPPKRDPFPSLSGAAPEVSVFLNAVEVSVVLTGSHEVVLKRPHRPPMSDAMKRISKSISRDTHLDYRTKSSLMAELMLDEAEFESAVEGLVGAGHLRRPITTTPGYRDWYREASRGLTLRERWNKFRMIAGRA